MWEISKVSKKGNIIQVFFSNEEEEKEWVKIWTYDSSSVEMTENEFLDMVKREANIWLDVLNQE